MDNRGITANAHGYCATKSERSRIIRVGFAAAILGLLTLANQGRTDGMKPVEEWLTEQANGDWLCDNGHYLVKFAKQWGYAGIEVRIIAGSGERLDQFWTPDLTFHPMCRMFDNISFMDAGGGEIQGFVTMNNTFVEARGDVLNGIPTLVLTGYLQRRADHSQGQIAFRKTFKFHADHYDANLEIDVPEGAAYRYADVWFDINDDWSNRYENSAGDIMNLRAGRADAEQSQQAHRTIAQLDRGYGIWMAVEGPRERLLLATDGAGTRSLPAAGITFFDGPDEEDPVAQEHHSHSCMGLGFIGGQSEPVALGSTSIAMNYSMFFLARGDFESLYGDK